MKKAILWSLVLGILINVPAGLVYSSDEETPVTEEGASESSEKGKEEGASEGSEKGKEEGASEGSEKSKEEGASEGSEKGKDKSKDEGSDKSKDKPKEEKPKKKKVSKPDDIKVSDECWDAMVEAKGDESGRDCKKALRPLRKGKSKDGDKPPCAGKENKKGFKKAIKNLCKKED